MKAGLLDQPLLCGFTTLELCFSQFKNCENHNVIILILIILIIVILILSYPFRSVIDLTDGIGAEIKNIWTIENYNLKLKFEKIML